FLNYHTKADTQVEGNLQIYGPGLRFLSHPERGDGGTALSHGTSDRLFLNEGVGLAGGTLIQGALSASPALITFDRYQMGAANLHDTGKSTADWACFIGGASFGSGDIFENGTGTLLTLHTYRNTTTSTWWVRMDFISHPVHEPHDVGVVCLRKGLFNIVTYWTGT
ncbi:MAG: hypothetical protein FJ098_11760, partial [Deltaproteobacteria bacterium]|nr:hypothetical protein [Deltaproteobacteria bacterium]